MNNKKVDIFKTLTIVCLVLIVVCMFRISSLKQDNKKLENEINNLFTQNENLKNNILSMVDSKLEQYNDILVSAYYDYEESKFDINNLDAKIKVEVLPKVFEPDTTKVYLVDGEGQYYPLEYNDNKYVGEISIPLFEQLFIDHVVLDNNGVLSSKALNWGIYPEESILPSIEITCFNDIEIKHKDHYIVNFKPDIHAFMYQNYTGNTIDIKSADLVVELGDIEIDRIPFKKSGIEDVKNLDLWEVNKKYDMTNNDDLYFYIDIVEGDFTIRRLVDKVSIDENGVRKYDSNLEDYYYTKNIRVKYQDKVIYDISEEIFK